MAFSLIGLLLMVVVIVLVVGGIAAAFRGRSGGSSSMGVSTPQAAAGVTLECPHCGSETIASRQVCSHCHMEL
ncbi:MAG: hypothetical protein H8E37_13595 [Planctomycetes bacterium]|nr:hypothetical protein [Planctomycetota bacterium]